MYHQHNMQGSDVVDIYVKKLRNQRVFVKNPYEFPYARPSSTANGNLEQKNYAEIEEDDKKFRWRSVIHERRVARCQGHNEKWTGEVGGCNARHYCTA